MKTDSSKNKHATKASKSAKTLRKRVKNNMQDVVEIIHNQKKGLQKFRNKTSDEQNQPVSYQQDTSIASEPSPQPVLHENALSGLIGEMVKTVRQHCEADPASISTTILGRFGALFEGNFAQQGEVQHYARASAVIVGNSSKSIINATAKTVDRIFDGSRCSYRYLSGQLSKVDDIICQVRDATFESDVFSRKKIKTDQGAFNKNLYVIDKNLAFSLNGKKSDLDTMYSTITGLLEDGNADLQISKDKRLKATGAHVAILAHIQRAELDLLRDKINMPNGFASCFLWILADRQGCIPLPEPIPEEKIEYFRRLISQRVEEANKHFGPVKMSGPARKLWEKAYPGLTKQYSGFAGSVVDRNDDHALRLALIYALAAGHHEIKIPDLKAAIAVVNYACESALLLFNGANQDKRQEKILQALRTAPKRQMSLTDISETVFKHNLASCEINKILKELEASKLVVIKALDGEVAGRRPTMVKLASAEHDQS